MMGFLRSCFDLSKAKMGGVGLSTKVGGKRNLGGSFRVVGALQREGVVV